MDVRNYGLDIIKILACFAVVGLHTFNRSGESISQLFFMGCGFAIPLFFMVNGYLVLSRQVSIIKLVRKIIKYVGISFIWTLPFSIIHCVKGKESFNPISDVIGELFLQQGTFPQFWYLGALSIVYSIICLLILKNNVIKVRTLALVCCISLGVVIIFDIITIASVLNGGQNVQEYVPQSLRLWTWLFYFTMPILAERFILKRKYITVWTVLLCFILKLIYDFYFGFRTVGIMFPEYYYNNIFTIIFVIVLFFKIKDSKIKYKWIKDLLDKVSADIMGVYILHLFVKYLLNNFIPVRSVLSQVALLVATFVCSIFLTEILRRIPQIKKIL